MKNAKTDVETNKTKFLHKLYSLNSADSIKERLAYGNELLEMYHEAIAWISVNDDEDPNDYEQVLLLLESGDIIQGMYCDDVNFCFTSPWLKKGQVITHWKRIVLPEKQTS